MVARGYRGLQGVISTYRGLQGVTGSYRGLQGVEGSYKRLQGVTSGYRRLLEVTRAYGGLQGITVGFSGYKELRGLQGLQWAAGGYRRLQGVTEGYKALPGVTGDFKELQEVKGGLQEVTGCYKGLPKSGGKAKSTSGESTKKRLSIVPGLERCGFFTPPVARALFRATLVSSCLRGAFPPVEFLAVCLVRAMTVKLMFRRLKDLCENLAIFMAAIYQEGVASRLDI